MRTITKFVKNPQTGKEELVTMPVQPTKDAHHQDVVRNAARLKAALESGEPVRLGKQTFNATSKLAEPTCGDTHTVTIKVTAKGKVADWTKGQWTPKLAKRPTKRKHRKSK